jgi:hypothetical protein
VYEKIGLHEYVQALVPLSASEWLGYGAVFAITLVAGYYITNIYRTKHAYLWVVVVSLAISWISLQLIMLWLYGAETWLPGRHTAIFFWGDSVCLPAIAVGFVALRRITRTERPWADRRGWKIAAAVLALTIATAFHWHEVTTWQLWRLHEFKKIYHDFVVYPLFCYFLGSQIPFLVQAPLALWRRRHQYQAIQRVAHSAGLTLAAILPFAGVFGWWWLGNVYDHAHPFVPLLGFA